MKYWYALIMVIFAAVLISPASAWLAYEPYGKQVSVTGNSYWYGNINNFSLPIVIYRSSGTDSGNSIYVSTNCNANYSDIRVTNSGDSLLPYWIQEDANTSSSATIWVRVPTVYKSSGTTLNVYYGNASFAAVSSGVNTWDVFDTFNGASLNSSTWASSGSITVGSGQCTIGSGASITANTASTSGTSFALFNSTRPNTITKQGWGDMVYCSYLGGYGDIFYYYSGVANYVTTGASTSYNTMMVMQSRDSGTPSYHDGYALNSLTPIWYYADNNPITYLSGTFAGAQVINYAAFGNTGYGSITYSWSTITPVTADFTANQTVIAPGAWVQFNDTSSGSPDHWWWSFGDGNTSTTRNATAKYWTAGTYNVALTAQQYGTNSTTTKTNYISVGQPPTTAFVANKTSGQNPLSIAFTDTSTLSPTFWNWSFGEGGNNTTTQNAVHTYTSSGSYQVILTSGNTYGSTSASTTITVQSSNNATGYGQYYASKTTTFHVQSAFGAPAAGATITMQGEATSAGSWDWLGQLLGLRFNETPIDNTVMTATTDSNGEAQFMVLPSVRYNVTIYQAGVISKTFTVTPTDDRYVVMLDWSIFGPTGKDVNAVDSFNLTKTINSATSVTLTLNGTDTAGHLTGGTAIVNQSTNGTETTIYSTALPSGNFSINIPLTNYAGNSYLVHVAATQSDYGTVYHDFGVTFPKAKVRPLNLDDKSLFMVSMVILFAVGGIFTATTKDKGALITCFAGWILYSLGYLDYMGSGVPVWLTLATVLSIAFIIAIGKVKGQ